MQTVQELLRISLWAQELTSEQMHRVESTVTERLVPVGGFAARKG